jgi:hypothetical protein
MSAPTNRCPAASVISDPVVGVALPPLYVAYIEPHPVEFPLVQRDLALHRSAAYDANAKQPGWLFLVARGHASTRTCAGIPDMTETRRPPSAD